MELYVKTRKEWRGWLEKNHSNTEKVWLVFYKKISGKGSISYDDAVEEALCFGWIDGKIKKINEDYYVRLFTPRNPRSRWSNINIERARMLIGKNLMKPVGLLAYQKVLDKPELAYEIINDGEPDVPEDLMKALENNSLAHGNFMKFSSANRRLYILWLNQAKRDATRISRIEKIVQYSEQNKKPGMI